MRMSTWELGLEAKGERVPEGKKIKRWEGWRPLLERALRVVEEEPGNRKKIDSLIRLYRKGDRSDGLRRVFEQVFA